MLYDQIPNNLNQQLSRMPPLLFNKSTRKDWTLLMKGNRCSI